MISLDNPKNGRDTEQKDTGWVAWMGGWLDMLGCGELLGSPQITMVRPVLVTALRPRATPRSKWMRKAWKFRRSTSPSTPTTGRKVWSLRSGISAVLFGMLPMVGMVGEAPVDLLSSWCFCCWSTVSCLDSTWGHVGACGVQVGRHTSASASYPEFGRISGLDLSHRSAVFSPARTKGRAIGRNPARIKSSVASEALRNLEI